MDMTIKRIRPLLEHPEIEVEDPLVGTFGVQPLKSAIGRDGLTYGRIRVYDYTGAVEVFTCMDEWPMDAPAFDGQYALAFRFVHDRYGNLVPVVAPGLGGLPSRSALELLPGHQAPDTQILERLVELADALQIESYREFLRDVFSDREFARAFVTLPGSKQCHHRESGGLLRHSLEVAESLQFSAARMGTHPLMADAAVLAGLFHDVGKVILASPARHRLPCSYRHHHWLVTETLAEPLLRLRHSDEQAHSALWRIMTGYQHGSHYEVPLAGLIRSLDAISAQNDALKHAVQEQPGRYWVHACGRAAVWTPAATTAS